MLAADDLNTATWRRLRGHLEARREELRVQLEKDSSPETTAKVRGRIAEIKELLALQAPAPASDQALASFGITGFGPDTNP